MTSIEHSLELKDTKTKKTIRRILITEELDKKGQTKEVRVPRLLKSYKTVFEACNEVHRYFEKSNGRKYTYQILEAQQGQKDF